MTSYVLMLQTDEDDKFLTHSTLSELGNNIPVKHVDNLEQLEELEKDSGLPSVILLNDRGPMHSGKSILKKLKINEYYNHIPVIVVGEVTAPEYVKECYKAGANSYITKPSSISETRRKIQSFFDYWFLTAETS